MVNLGNVSAHESRTIGDVRTIVETVSERLANLPILNGVLITDVSITVAGTPIAHGLDRAFRGWIVVDQDGTGVVYSGTQTDELLFLVLRTTVGTQTISLWVF
jgi:hypothetical protein